MRPHTALDKTAARSASVRVVPFDGSDAQWDATVADLEESDFSHLAGWRHVFGGVLGHEEWRWVAVDGDDREIGLLPLVRVRSRLFGDYLLSMPFLSYGGPLGSEAAKAALVAHSVEEARRLGVDLLELRTRRRLPGDLTVSHRKITVTKSLPPSSEELWDDGLRSKVRSQIRRPKKAGMTAEFGVALVDDFYAVFSRTMRDLGTPVLPKTFFEGVARHLAPHVVFCVIRSGPAPVAAGCGFAWNGEVEITWAGALREHSREAPNMLLYWSFMEEAIRRGATTFNFGRCTPGSGTHRFKGQWGTDDQPLPWAQWTNGGVGKTPSPDGRKYEIATALWSRLPMPVANRMGPLISPSLP